MALLMRDKDPIYVARPFLPHIDSLMEYVRKIYESRTLTNRGPLVSMLEEELSDFLGVRHLILTANGTLALQVAYRALGLKQNVITTPFSFVATTSTLVWEGIRPVFADIHPRKLTLDPVNIAKNVTAGTTGIVPVHVFGNPCDVESIKEIAEDRRLRVVYDAAHAFGVKYKGKSILNHGDVSILSFHATKLFHTIEGGAIVTSDAETARLVRSMINFGITGYDKISGLGINAKMNEFEAAMGLCVLKNFPRILASYRKAWMTYHESLDGLVDFPELSMHTEWNYSYVPILLRDEKQLLKVKKKLNANRIYPRRYFYPSLDTLQYLVDVSSHPVSRSVSQRILCLPNYYGLNQVTIKMITKLIKETVEK